MMGRLIEILQELGALNHLRRAGAGWVAATCPCCGERKGKDKDGEWGNRLLIQPEDTPQTKPWARGLGFWKCRKCEVSGSGLDLLERLGMTRAEARERLVGRRGVMKMGASGPKSPRSAPWWTWSGRAAGRQTPPAPLPLPPRSWMTRMTAYAATARTALAAEWRELERGQTGWRTATAAYLAGRGLTLETALDAGLGAAGAGTAEEKTFRLPEFGIHAKLKYGDDEFCMPRGVLIPVYFKGAVVGVSIHHWGNTSLKHQCFPGISARCSVFERSLSYYIGNTFVVESRTHEMNQDLIRNFPRIAMIMESALDAALAWQGSRRSVTAIGIGGRWPLHADALAAVRGMDAVIVVPDGDAPGRQGARRWMEQLEQLHIPAEIVWPATGKDLTESHQAAMQGGMGLRAEAWWTMIAVPALCARWPDLRWDLVPDTSLSPSEAAPPLLPLYPSQAVATERPDARDVRAAAGPEPDEEGVPRP